MTDVFPGRYTASMPTDATAVFLIGMRVNTFRGLLRARRTASAMPRMMRHLLDHPESGLLAAHNWFGRTTIMLSYWRSAEDVQRFASDPAAPHAAAWREFTRKIGVSRDLGVWHELYTIRRGDYEGVYANMPRFGMAGAGEHLVVGAGMRTSRQRMRAGAEPALR